MFWGMIAPGEAAVPDREQRVVVGLGALVEVRALGRARRGPLPWVPAALSVWQPAQWLAKSTAPFVVGVVLGDRDPFLAEAAGREPESRGDNHRYDEYWTHAARIILVWEAGAVPAVKLQPTPRSDER